MAASPSPQCSGRRMTRRLSLTRRKGEKKKEKKKGVQGEGGGGGVRE